jgi:hypothetical protein
MANRTDTFYAAEAAIHGYGAQLEVGNGSSPTETFQAIAGVISITPGAMNTEDINRTHLRSPDAHHEHMPGLRDSGAFTCEMIWLPTDESQSLAGGGSVAFTGGGLVDMWKNRTIHNFKIVLYDDGSPSIEWPFRGYVSQFQPGQIGVADKINATVSFQPTEDFSADLP